MKIRIERLIRLHEYILEFKKQVGYCFWKSTVDLMYLYLPIYVYINYVYMCLIKYVPEDLFYEIFFTWLWRQVVSNSEGQLGNKKSIEITVNPPKSLSAKKN